MSSTGTDQTLPSPMRPVRGALDQDVDDVFDILVVHEHLKSHLGNQVDGVFRPPVYLGVAR